MRTAGQGPKGFEKREGLMKPGQDLVMAGFAGFDGTCRIWERRREELEKHFPSLFLKCLNQAEHGLAEQWMKHWMSQDGCPVTAYEFAGEGGVLAALWNLSGVFHAGIDINLRSVPVRQVTVEICELYELNPYRLLCGDCAIMAADHGGQVVRRLKAEGITAVVIGCVTEGIARRIRHEEENAGYLERPRPDELLKVAGP